MPRRAIASLAALFLTAAPVAAEPWSDAQSHLAFTAPEGWSVSPVPADGMTYVLALSGSQECHVLALPRPETAGINADRIRRGAVAAIPREAWRGVPAVVPSVFSADAALTDLGVDQHGAWPIQMAQFSSANQIVHAGIQFRPGVEFWAFCLSRTGNDDPETYTSVLRSVAATNDAQLEEEIAAIERSREVRAEMRDADRRSSMMQLRNNRDTAATTVPPSSPD